MKVRKSLAVCFTALLILSTLVANAQSTYDLQFANSSVSGGASPTFCIDLQIRAADGAPDFYIGSHTVFFEYNKNAVTNSTYTPYTLDPSLSCEIAPGTDYSPFQDLAFGTSEIGVVGEANVNTLLQAYIPGFECPLITNSWLSMGQVCFDIIDDTQSPDLSFNTNFTIANLSDDTPEHTQGTFTGYSAILGSACTVDAGSISADASVVCFGDDITFSTSGSSLESDNYLALIVTNSTSVTDISVPTIYSPTPAELTGSSFVYSNNGSTPSLPTDTDLYAYTFVGLGTPNNYDPNCTDISAGEGPFVLLSEIQSAQSDYVCLGGGTAAFNVVVSGSTPAYDGSTYTITASNATVLTTLTPGDNVTTEVTVADGANWSLTFTDDNNCSTTLSGIFDADAVCGASCSVDAGTPSFNETLVCWGDDIDFAVSGYTLGTDNYIGLASSTDNALDVTAEPTFSSLFAGDATSYTNDGTSFGINTPYYVYSFVGEGDPYNINPACYDQAVTTSSFIMLGEILINNNEAISYSCAGNGTANVFLAAAGGMPFYDDVNESYTVSITGLSTPYTGPTTVAHLGGVNFTVTDGDSWTATFTDSNNCSATVSDTFDEISSCDLPDCPAVAGVPSFTPEFICVGDDITLSVTGYTLGDETDGYVGLITSPDNAITGLGAGPVIRTIDDVTATNSVTYTNDGGTSLDINTELYVYSFIGEGSTGSFSTCTDLSAAAGPFVLLQDIFINGADATIVYNCNNDGTATVDLSAVGGLPLYDAAEFFAISTSNATYTGGDVANGETISISVNDGATWSVTFTDDNGCANTIGGTYVENADNCSSGGSCIADAGTPSITGDFICFGESIDLSVSGYTLNVTPNSYIGLAVSGDADGGANIGDLTPLFEVFQTDNETYTHDANTNLNVPLYLYSFIGEGSIGSFNPECTDLAGPIGPL